MRIYADIGCSGKAIVKHRFHDAVGIGSTRQTMNHVIFAHFIEPTTFINMFVGNIGTFHECECSHGNPIVLHKITITVFYIL